MFREEWTRGGGGRVQDVREEKSREVVMTDREAGGLRVSSNCADGDREAEGCESGLSVRQGGVREVGQS